MFLSKSMLRYGSEMGQANCDALAVVPNFHSLKCILWTCPAYHWTLSAEVSGENKEPTSWNKLQMASAENASKQFYVYINCISLGRYNRIP